jgi:hypothetical protein
LKNYPGYDKDYCIVADEYITAEEYSSKRAPCCTLKIIDISRTIDVSDRDRAYLVGYEDGRAGNPCNYKKLYENG